MKKNIPATSCRIFADFSFFDKLDSAASFCYIMCESNERIERVSLGVFNKKTQRSIQVANPRSDTL